MEQQRMGSVSYTHLDVYKRQGKDSVLWYQRTVKIKQAKKNEKLLLHFGAVDWQAEVFVNGKSVVLHEGGYDPFTVDITEALRPGTAPVSYTHLDVYKRQR